MNDPRPLIDTSLITTEVSITEDALRGRLIAEVLTSLGLLRHDGTMRPGVTAKALRGEGRGGGYRVQITRDMKLDDTPRLTGPQHG